jgi:hypothetical protein
MITCSREEMNQYVINSGYIYTSDIFILLTNVYMRVLSEKQYALKHPGNVMEHILRQSDLYLCWNYKTGVRRYVDVDTFRTQFKLYTFIKDTHEDAMDNLFQEILDNDLSAFAIHSEHML